MMKMTRLYMMNADIKYKIYKILCITVKSKKSNQITLKQSLIKPIYTLCFRKTLIKMPELCSLCLSVNTFTDMCQLQILKIMLNVNFLGFQATLILTLLSFIKFFTCMKSKEYIHAADFSPGIPPVLTTVKFPLRHLYFN